MKQVFVPLIIIAFLGQTFSKNFIEADYYFFNTAAYAKNCENKAKPQIHCNGKCQMMKKIKQEEKKNDQLPNQASQNKSDIPLSSKSYFPKIGFPDTKSNTNFYKALQFRKEIKMPRSIFHPPTV